MDVRSKKLRFIAALVIILALTLTIVGVASADSAPTAPMPGAVWTTNVGCTEVNGNIFADKGDVFINGGPKNGSAGLPDGLYWVKVTEPDGTLLGQLTDPDNRVLVAGGEFQGCYNLFDLTHFANTTNSGGEYKVWVSTDPTFPNDASKTDNFKVLPNAQDLTVTKTARPSYTRTFDWGIDKSADKDTVYSAGGGESEPVNFTVTVTKDAGTDSDFYVSGEITVHNPNTFDVSGVNVTDGACPVMGGQNLTIPAGGDVEASYICTFSSNPGSGTNTALATWYIGSPSTSATGSADYTFGDPTTVIDDAIDVNDTNGQVWHFTDSGSQTYQMTYTDPAGTCTPHENTATIIGLGKSATATVQDCQGADLTLSKTAVTAYDRTFTWGITKGVDKTLVKQFGGTATFNYTVTVNHDAGTDSNWTVSGTITVVNPNDWEDVIVDVSDTIPGCVVPDGTAITVPAGQSVTLLYSCSLPSGDAGTNTATATWDAAAYHTPDGAVSVTADFTFGDPTNLIDECVTVSDSYAGYLGKVCVGDPNPKSFNYSRTITVPQWNCVPYDNTAAFTTNDTGTPGSASKTVKVCGPAKTGALTMGYWQNSNGQGIIKAGASTAGVCNSGTWLRQYAPFQDLSATATCTQVASYVYNLIKAANASGASMNAMLKAQTLATALDVYFSNAALGGNKIGAPAPIGGVSVDLTKICTDLSCTAFENSSSVFGGSPKTVLQMLSYAASQSNVGGSTWYGNVKNTQELAKDAFDALNNQKVFAP